MIKKKGDTLLKIIFIAGIFLLPFIFWPWAVIPYEIPRVWFVQRWVEVLVGLGVVGVILGWVSLARKKTDSVLVLLVLAFLLTALASSLQGVDFTKSFWGNYYRGDGLFTLFHLVGFFFFLLLFWQKTWRKDLILALGLGAFLLSIWTIILSFSLHALGNTRIEDWNRAVGVTFGQPVFLAGYLLVTMPVLAYLTAKAKNSRRKKFWGVAILIQFLAIVLTLSWGAVLGIVVFLGGWFLLKRGIWIWKILIGVVALILVIGAVFWIWDSKPRFALDADGSSLVAHPESRERMWVKGLLAFRERPLLGWGWANFDYAFDSVVWPIKVEVDAYVDKAHSTPFEILVTTGIVGAVVYLAIVLWALGRLYMALKGSKGEYRMWVKTLSLVFLLYLFHSQTNVISIGEELLFWLVLGIIASEGLTPS
ncbi:hypothetical protein CMO96_01985 [Candidatus Woesebacteria bacterium]|nr:hypothetical protein [Candidatus Woesebacteria bacterium]